MHMVFPAASYVHTCTWAWSKLLTICGEMGLQQTMALSFHGYVYYHGQGHCIVMWSMTPT